MEIVVFLAVGLILYFAADWVLNRIEAVVKRRLEYRTLIFFAILLGSALIVFPLIRKFFGG